MRGRRDIRSEEDTKISIIMHSKEEYEYLDKWLNIHHKKRKKKDYIIIPWGNKIEKGIGRYYPDNAYEELQGFARPDILLCKLYDHGELKKNYNLPIINREVVKWIAPMEIQTIGPNLASFIYIKVQKITWSYDSLTSKITSRGVCILCIMDTYHKGDEIYTLISPREIKTIKEKFKPEPSPNRVFGGKLAYKIPIKRRWKDLSNPTPFIQITWGEPHSAYRKWEEYGRA